ncbi:MAG: hypothetical protein JW900_07890 [Anaerolineae bacterium]|nr:hypothetical protein [Anaerolineae bacterium]
MKGSRILVSVALGVTLLLAMLALLADREPSQAQAGGSVIRVYQYGTDAPGCGGEGDPCATIQYAVDQALDGEEIWVAAGTYSGVQARPAPPGYPGPAVITQVVYISKTVTIRGGYDVTFAGPPDPSFFTTTVDAQGEGRVLFIAGDISPTVEGLHITGGDAAGLGGHGADECGGGLYVFDTPAVIRNNTFNGNTASARGGGFFIRGWDSAALLEENDFYNNTTDSMGGGGYLQDSPATVRGNTFFSNTAGFDAGAMYANYSTPLLEGNIFVRNKATAHHGGAMYIRFSTATLIDNVFTANWAQGGGGALYLWGGNCTLINNVMVDNEIDWGHGTALHVEAGSQRLLHNTIARNHGGYGTAIIVRDSWGNPADVVITNTIIVSHEVGVHVALPTSNTAELNGVLWYSNTTNIEGDGTFTVTYAITGHPAFASDGYHIAPGSAARDAGIDSGVLRDIDDSRRDDFPDIGADEFACWARLASSGVVYDTVQEAVDAAPDGDLVQVAGYCVGTHSRAGIQQAVYLSKTLTVQGGYTPTNWSLPPDPLANPATLDAVGTGRVFTVIGDTNPTIEGLHVTGGWLAWPESGGGFSVISAAATISDCWISGNRAAADGGGVFLLYSPATLIGNTIFDNRAAIGGGVSLVLSPATLRENVITGNRAQEDGGGVASWDSDIATLDDNVVCDNSAYMGGGMWIQESSVGSFDRNTICDNRCSGLGGGVIFYIVSTSMNDNVVSGNVADPGSVGWGGGILLFRTTITATANVISGNVAFSGGGLYAYLPNTITLESNLIRDNRVVGSGGGLVMVQSYSTLNGNVIVNNSASQGAGGIRIRYAGMTIVNGVIADNDGGGISANETTLDVLHTTIACNGAYGIYVESAPGQYTTVAMTNTILVSQTTGLVMDDGCTATLESTLWYGNGQNWGGGGIISHTNDYTGHPAFVDPNGGDYHLAGASAAIDMGIDAGLFYDFDGDSRPLGGGFDLGADEYLATGLQFVPDRAGTADPGTTVVYHHILTNTGSLSDTYDLTHSSSQGWTVAYGTPVTVDPGDAVTVLVSVTLPSGAISGTVDVAVITATSQAEPSLFAAVHDTTMVACLPGVQLGPDGSALAEPDMVVTYTHVLTNSGNYTDSFDISHASSQGWTVSYTPLFLLGRGQTATLVVSVTVPVDASNGMVDTTIVTATSQADPAVFDTVTDTTMVGQALRIYLPLVVKN